MNGILAMTLKIDEHPGRVKAGSEGATRTNYFHMPCQYRKSYTNEEINREAKAINEVIFEARWKAR